MLLELELKYVQRFVLRQARMIIILVRHFLVTLLGSARNASSSRRSNASYARNWLIQNRAVMHWLWGNHTVLGCILNARQDFWNCWLALMLFAAVYSRVPIVLQPECEWLVERWVVRKVIVFGESSPHMSIACVICVVGRLGGQCCVRGGEVYGFKRLRDCSIQYWCHFFG